MPPERMRSATTADGTRSPRCVGNTTPCDTAPTWWPARPIRCRPDATEGARRPAPRGPPRPCRCRARGSTSRRPRAGGRPELGLRARALGPAHRPVVRAGDDRLDARARARLRLHLRRGDRARVEHVLALPLGPQLVHARGEPFRAAARVREDERRAVVGDEVDDALLDVRPDGRARRADVGSARRAGRGRAREVALAGWQGRQTAVGPRAGVGHERRRPEVREVGDGHDDVDLDALARRRLHDDDLAPALGLGPVPAEEGGDRLDRADRGRQADALRGWPLVRLEQGVQALERHGEVGAPLGPGHRVDLVDDHRLDAHEPRARLRRQHEEQRLGRRDEDVRRVRGEPAALARGVSPVRVPTTTSGTSSPSRTAAWRMPASGERRFRSTSAASALSGET